jgi:Nif-specific regulatory protein
MIFADSLWRVIMMCDKSPGGPGKDRKTRNQVEEFQRVSRELKNIPRSEMSYDLDLFLNKISQIEFSLGELDTERIVKFYLFGIKEFVGAGRAGVFFIDRDLHLDCLSDMNMKSRIDSLNWKDIHRNIKEMFESNDLVFDTIGDEETVFYPLPIGIAGKRHFLVLSGLSGQSRERIQCLVDSVQFEVTSRIVRKQVLFSELLKETEYGLLNGNSFFRVTEMEFERSRSETTSLAIGAIAIQSKEVADKETEMSPITSIEENMMVIRSVLQPGNLFTSHDPGLFTVLMPEVTKEEVEKTFVRLKRAFEVHSKIKILFGVSFFDGTADSDYTEFLMTLSEALDRCLDGSTQFIVKNASIKSFSKFAISDKASELLYHSLDHNKLLTLYKISQMFGGVYQLDRLFDRILELALSAIGAERGLFCVQEGGADLRIAASRNTYGAIKAELNMISRSIIRDSMNKKKPIISQEVEKDENLKSRESVISYGIRSVLCMPLFKRDSLYGALYLDVRSGNKRFALSDLIFLKAFSIQAVMAIENVALHEKKETEIRKLQKGIGEGLESIVGQSDVIRSVVKKLVAIQDNDITVLIEGESGTGKELFAKAIHASSQRKDKPLLTIDCSSISGNIIESELFGHTAGAFTDAKTERMGLFEACSGGTVFIDELDSLSTQIQGKLLRVIEEGEVRRLGENNYRKVDVRIITTTKTDLRRAAAEGTFREDLFYRLNVFKIRIPLLRERKDDIPLLAGHFCQMFSSRYGKQILGLSQEAIEYLTQHPWPGNVRELRNMLERAVVNSVDEIISREDLSLDTELEKSLVTEGLTLKERLDITQHELICEALRENHANITATAKVLGLSRRGLQKFLQKHEINKEDYK